MKGVDMSKTKTCGECKYRYSYHHDEDCNGRCKLFIMYRIPSNKPACSNFKPIPPPTNGDRIRQMSNEELATCIEGLAFRFSSRREFVAWLNAPADCVKQNGNHDTQPGLCKAGDTERVR